MTFFRGLKRDAARFAAEESAVSATEYAVLLALLVLVAVATINQIGSRIMNIYTAIEVTIPTAT